MSAYECVLASTHISFQCGLVHSAYSLTRGWYAVAIQIEDFATTTSTTPLSSIPLQFLVYVFDSSASCASRPELVSPTPPDGSCYPVATGSSWSARIVARSGSSSVRYPLKHNKFKAYIMLYICSSSLAHYTQTA